MTIKTHTQTSHHILTPHHHDILKGKGKKIQSHTGNVFFRTLVKQYKDVYTKSQSRKQKHTCCDMIYSAIVCQDPPGRFLQQDPMSKAWTETTKCDAYMKIKQALREGPHATKNNRKRSCQTIKNITKPTNTHKCAPMHYDYKTLHNISGDVHVLSSISMGEDSSFEEFIRWISGSDIW